MSVLDISVIIPTYNCSILLRQAIDSCLSQDGVSLEIVVVNDASTDDTAAVLASFGPPVRSLHLDGNHGNGCFARNVGIKNAKGRYIKFLDHDDVLEPGALAKEFSVAVKENADMVMSGWGWCSIDEDGNIITDSSRTFEPPPSEDVIDAILGDRKVPFTAAVLYKRDYIKDMEWDNNAGFRDDFDWFCRTALKGGKIAVSPGIAYWWRVNPNSISMRRASNDLSFLETAYVMNKILQKVEDRLQQRTLLTDMRKEKLAHQYYTTGLRAFSRFDRKKFKAVLSHIFELSPNFQPTTYSEYNRMIRFLCRLIGVRPTLTLYSVVRCTLDKLSSRRVGQPE